MKFDDLLKRREIKHRVDQRVSEPNPTPTEAGVDPSKVNIQTVSDLPTLVQDTIDLAVAIEKNTITAIDTIVTANSGQDIFDSYSQVLKLLYNEPNSSIAGLSIPYAKIQTLERQVYLNTTDPRASLLRDIYRKLTEIQSTLEVLKRLWSSITTFNKLYKNVHESRLARLALLKHQQWLKTMAISVDTVLSLTVPELGEDFTQSIIQKIQIQASDNVLNTGFGEIGDTIALLTYTIRDFGYQSLNHYEKYQDSLDSEWGRSVRENYERKLTTDYKYSHFLGINQPVTNFLSDLASFSPNPEQILELKRQSEFSLYSAAQAVEDAMIQQERADQLKVQETLYNNVKQVAYSKAFVHVLNELNTNLSSLPINILPNLEAVEAALDKTLKEAIRKYRNLKTTNFNKAVLEIEKVQKIVAEVQNIVHVLSDVTSASPATSSPFL